MRFIKAEELQPGQIIRVEYGDVENRAVFLIEQVTDKGSYFTAHCKWDGVCTDLTFDKGSEVEVLGEEDLMVLYPADDPFDSEGQV